MISLKVLSAAAVMALMLPLATPTESFARDKGMGIARGGGGGPPGARVSGGGGGGFHGGVAPGPRFRGRRRRLSWRLRRRLSALRRWWRLLPGAVIGGVIGGAIASQSYGYYGAPGYYGPGYYDDGYYDSGVVAVAPGPAGGDDVAYCMQTYRSYDPRSGTYLGYDGYRHPCP